MKSLQAKKGLNGKWALVTGASRGIGQQIARGLAAYGCNVMIHGRQLQHTEATQKIVSAYTVETCCVAGELDSDEGIQTILEGVATGPGRVDILYNNAAVMSKAAPICEITQAEWMRVFKVNVFAMVQLCNAFTPAMATRGYGRVINLTSGIADQPRLAPYSVSKAAVDKYSRDLAFEYREQNVLVNTLDPGWLKTDLGGPDAWHEVESVLPGALVPALLEDNGPSGRFFAAQDYKYPAD
ncbi:MAG: SDR family NAD(P)-dependent oxidoreductase [Gammaproteobacteria bacterium]|nr:SDR family NAD(P)-dependent oxidoreductase [Gammaproteobacteria bacterium]